MQLADDHRSCTEGFVEHHLHTSDSQSEQEECVMSMYIAIDFRGAAVETAETEVRVQDQKCMCLP